MFIEPTRPSVSKPRRLLRRLAHAYRLLGARGALLDGPAHPMATRAAGIDGVPGSQSASRSLHPDDLALFVARAGELLAATNEPARQRLEKDVLDLAVPLHAGGLFKILRIAHPALSTMVADHLAALNEPPAQGWT